MSNAADEDIRQMNEIVERARATDEHGHGLCPMCGYRACINLNGEEDEPSTELWAGCARDCFRTRKTIKLRKPVSSGQVVSEWACRRAWEAWDRAWWRR